MYVRTGTFVAFALPSSKRGHRVIVLAQQGDSCRSVYSLLELFVLSTSDFGHSCRRAVVALLRPSALLGGLPNMRSVLQVVFSPADLLLFEPIIMVHILQRVHKLLHGTLFTRRKENPSGQDSGVLYSLQ